MSDSTQAANVTATDDFEATVRKQRRLSLLCLLCSRLER